jgi:hypothetical protein
MLNEHDESVKALFSLHHLAKFVDCSTCISGKVFSCEPGSKNYKYRSTDILISICGELHLQSDVEMVLKKHEIVYEVHSQHVLIEPQVAR